MGSVGLPKPLPPYVYDSSGSHGGCSEMICTKNCLQWCINLLPPPPSDEDSGPNFSPLIIVIITILASALFFVTFYTVCTNYTRRRRRRRQRDLEANLDQTPPVAIPADDAAEIVKKNIKVFKYKKACGGVGGGDGGAVQFHDTECSVCLAEFVEDENLRLLPKCSHVFHLLCIDTWLKSQPSCPICRANVVPIDPSPLPAPTPATAPLASTSRDN
ncbi:unnamed protein product [Cuscuta europaea]|uniref:RING-type E3 ubiquitin transferase n=1 Tax=Cuscuta europaea TaxID=41803 RepID=A0A9P1ED03_CUSEU|nr:unnamed protein product [Cuscuta europaea]